MIARPGELLRRHGLAARKQWGQHFLHDPSVLAAIVRAAQPRPERRILEIGAGLGTLTSALLEAGAPVWAIERDRDMCAVLRAELGTHPGFTLHEADAVRFDYTAAGPADVVGNLPYHLTGPLLFALLEHHTSTGPWVVMVQKEVADRLCASPGTKTYGSLTVVLSRVREISSVVSVARGAFMPPPRVDSAVIKLAPREAPRGEVGDADAFRAFVRTIFQKRRKTMLNALTPVAGRDKARAWCDAAGIDASLRPERITVEEFAALQRAREADDA